MASLHQLLAAVQASVISVTQGLSMFDSPLTVETGLFWPPPNTLARFVKLRPPTCGITIFDRKTTKDTTRWLPVVISQTAFATGIRTSLTTPVPVPSLGSAQVSVSGTSTPGDAISLVVTDFTLISRTTGVASTPLSTAVVFSPLPSSGPSDIVLGLAGRINADPTLSTIVQATASGPILTVTSLGDSFTVASYAGNGGTEVTEVARRCRDVQITVWAPSQEIRDIVGDPIDSLIGQLEVFYGDFQSGLVLGDGSFARIMLVNDFLLDDPVKADLFRRDFIISADYPVTTQDALYSILAPQLSVSASYASS